MKFLADVNVSRRAVAALVARGFEVTRVSEIMDCRATDGEILAEARRRAAIVITHDQDFTALLAVGGATGPSLINVRVSYVDAERMATAIASAIHAASAELATGAIVTLDDGGIRVHQLPVT